MGALALAAADAQAGLFLPGSPNSSTVLSAAAGAAWEFRSGADPLGQAAEAIAWEGLAENAPPQQRLAKTQFAEERKAQVAILRDIIGNPFRSVKVDRRWLTDAVIDVADSLYNNQTFNHLTALADALDKAGISDACRFQDMPILGDALEEAGCTQAEILNHCRRPGVHVKGCWLLDFLLGKW